MKKTPTLKQPNTAAKTRKSNEPLAVYRSVKIIPAYLDFPYRKFSHVASLVPFTQREWAAILQLSEKTLQRYSKANKNFEGIYAERILQMQELIEMGLAAFMNADKLYEWLKKDKQVLGHLLNFDCLCSNMGIQLVKEEFGRMLHDIYINSLQYQPVSGIRN